jgi:hypothetical protein
MADIGGLNLPPEILAKLAELNLELSEGKKLRSWCLVDSCLAVDEIILHP